MNDTVALWRNRDYIRFRIARFVSVLGSQLSWIAYPLLILSIGGSAVQAGAVASCALIVAAVARFPGGHIADKFDRRWLMISLDTARFAVVATIPLAAAVHGLSFPQILAVAVIDSAGGAFFDPATTAFIRDIVPTDQLGAAMGQAQASSSAVSLLGPTLGGALFGVSRMLPFTGDAVSYALSAVLILGVAARPPRPEPSTVDRRASAGLRWLGGQPRLVRLLIFVAVINLVASALNVAVVISLHDRGVPAATIGLLLTCVGVGGVVGASCARFVTKLLEPERLYVSVGLIWFAGLLAFALAPDEWVIGIGLALFFLCTPAAAVVLGQVTLTRAPREMLGRVSTAEKVATATLATVGPILAGISLQEWGERPTWLILSGCCLAATVYFAVASYLGRPSRSAQVPASATAAAPAVTPVGAAAAAASVGVEGS